MLGLKILPKLYQVTYDIMSNDVSHVFTEIILNVMFPNFIVDPDGIVQVMVIQNFSIY